MPLSSIIAISQNLAIGRDGKLPWHYSSDLKFFKRTTSGNAILMGYNTWLSIGKPLPNRLNVILTRNHEIEPRPGVVVLRSVEDAVEFSKYLTGELFIIGGASVYDAFADHIEKWIVTEMPETIEDADTFMPEGFLNGWTSFEKEEIGEGLTVRTYYRSELD